MSTRMRDFPSNSTAFGGVRVQFSKPQYWHIMCKSDGDANADFVCFELRLVMSQLLESYLVRVVKKVLHPSTDRD